ncbi:hypothetical protein [Sphingobacterium litopenaei]|uniref:Uncharacterized protein n=1 Tax=Sphingobacterium litopenaei TaxID=2763500 RepID=A0ABR7YBZ9_9SPHI|nr:hypothetical protein [Sphingobacterium litopenaei]MBD1428810.1 hypothetical protein [Sphingobacterium litopenaei]
MDHIQLLFNTRIGDFYFDVDTVLIELMKGTNIVNVKLEIDYTIDDLDVFIHVLIEKIRTEKNTLYQSSKRDIIWGGSTFSTVQPVSRVVYDLIINK